MKIKAVIRANVAKGPYKNPPPSPSQGRNWSVSGSKKLALLFSWNYAGIRKRNKAFLKLNLYSS
jgi:hypothetical protein